MGLGAHLFDFALTGRLVFLSGDQRSRQGPLLIVERGELGIRLLQLLRDTVGPLGLFLKLGLERLQSRAQPLYEAVYRFFRVTADLGREFRGQNRRFNHSRPPVGNYQLSVINYQLSISD